MRSTPILLIEREIEDALFYLNGMKKIRNPQDSFTFQVSCPSSAAGSSSR